MADPGRRARDGAELGRRMRAFLADEARGGDEIADLIGHLGQAGEVAIFGGMPRDIAWGGADAFGSDVDLVVDTAPGRLAELLRDGRAVRNRFGGYRIAGRRHSYDVWALPSTWAVRTGHVRATRLADLVHTTFFDRDAVLYLCGCHRVHHGPRFAAWLGHCTVDINLEEDPNPRGTALRALRILLEPGQAVGPRLADYLRRMATAPGHHLDADTVSRLAAAANLAGAPSRPVGPVAQRRCSPAEGRARARDWRADPAGRRGGRGER